MFPAFALTEAAPLQKSAKPIAHEPPPNSERIWDIEIASLLCKFILQFLYTRRQFLHRFDQKRMKLVVFDGVIDGFVRFFAGAFLLLFVKSWLFRKFAQKAPEDHHPE